MKAAAATSAPPKSGSAREKAGFVVGEGDDVVRFNVRCQYIPKREFV